MEPYFREITLGHLQHIPRVGQEHIAVVAVFGHKLVFALFEVFKSLGIVTFYPASLIEADGFPAALGSILVEKTILYDLELQLPDSAYDFTAIELVDKHLSHALSHQLVETLVQLLLVSIYLKNGLGRL